MPCPHCQAETTPGARFCAQCGQRLAPTACASCGTELPARARFCAACGQPVGDATPTDDARLRQIAAATPAGLAQKMRSVGTSGERKLVTTLFADVVGSTALAERMDPEDWTGIMNGAFERLSPAIHRYEGTIARLMGDALLAFFGAPLAHEDDPQRAVRAALDLVAAARDYADEVRRAHGVEFQVRVGINSGLVLVGEVGSDLKFEYTAMGDAVNVAARVQAAATPMTVLIAEPTHRFVAAAFDCRDLGGVEMKGKAEPVRVFEVLGPRAAPARARGLAGLESPLVGRAAELAALVSLVDAAHAGRGGVAAIVGEPGLGKSRLIAEWKTALAGGAPLAWAEGRCVSYGQGLTYYLVADTLRSLVGIPAAAEVAEARATLRVELESVFGDDWPDVYAGVLPLLGLPPDDLALERSAGLDPQELQQRSFAAVRRLLRAAAVRRPLVLVLDDVHWADPSSVDLLTRLLPLADEAPVVFCFVTRPDPDTAGWRLVQAARDRGADGLVELHLQPLSEAESDRLVSGLLDVPAFPAALRTLILRKAEGNPFFVEEVVRMLIDRGVLVRGPSGWSATREVDHVEVPDNLLGLLQARIDRLPDEARLALRVASVIGRQFPVRVLEQVLAEAAGPAEPGTLVAHGAR